MKPFAGIRVLDMSRLIAGPICAQMFGDLGAEVIKVEPPEGDDSRKLGPPFVDGNGVFFLCCNGGKQSVVIDLASPEGLADLYQLAESADIVIENFRPGVADRLRVGFEAIRKINPNVVYCSITGFGDRDGDRGGVDTIFQSEGGLISLIGEGKANPAKVGSPVADVAAAQIAAFAVAAALIERNRSGEAQHVKLSIRDALVSLLAPAAMYAVVTGKAPPTWGNASQFAAPADIFDTADGSIAISIINNRHWTKLCHVLGAQELLAEGYRDPADRLDAREELTQAISSALRKHPTQYWEYKLAKEGIPFGKIRDMAEIVTQSRLANDGMLIPMGGLDGINLPFSVNGTRPTQRSAPPSLGEHKPMSADPARS